MTLREGARFHNGQPADADCVRQHFKRWLGFPEHAWLEVSRHVRDVSVQAGNQIRLTLDEPYALLPDLCAINPCAIRGPGAIDKEGDFIGPCGTGAFQFVSVVDNAFRFRNRTGGSEVELVPVESGSPIDVVDALLRGEVDVVADGWFEAIPRKRVAEVTRDPEVGLAECAGSSVVYLSFRLEDGPTADRSVRRAVARAVGRDELIRRAEHGFADPCHTWAAPTVSIWPASAGPASETPWALPWEALCLLVTKEGRQEAVGHVLMEQLERAGVDARLVTVDEAGYSEAVEQGDYDIRIEQTWGVPYDPYISLTARFLPPPREPSAASERFFGVDPRLVRLVLDATRQPDEAKRSAVYASIQSLMDEEALIVPLYVPRRLALVRSDIVGLELDHDLYHLNLTGIRRVSDRQK